MLLLLSLRIKEHKLKEGPFIEQSKLKINKILYEPFLLK